jgi:hypothetical protein
VLVNSTSGVVLMQIRVFLGLKSRLGVPGVNGGMVGELLRGFVLISSLTDAFLSARAASSVLRNDQEVAALGDIHNGMASRPDLFMTVVFKNSAQALIESTNQQPEWPGKGDDPKVADSAINAEVAMTWNLTQTEKRSMDRAIPDDVLARS